MKETLLTQLRNRATELVEFRRATHKLASLLAAEISQTLQETACTVQTPLGSSIGKQVEQPVLLVPVLRAGMALLPAFLYHFEHAKVGFLGIRREEETARAYEYYENLTAIHSDDLVLVLDPMIATGGTARLAIDKLKGKGAKEAQLFLVSLIASKEGLASVREYAPKVRILTVGVDPTLNTHKFIVPGLGDFGDRYFGTD